MKNSTATILLLFAFHFSTAQVLGYEKASNDSVVSNLWTYAMTEGAQNKIYTAGLYANSQNIYARTYLSEWDSLGNLRWEKDYVCGFNADNVYGIAADENGVFMAGVRVPGNLSDPSPGLIMRTDTAGQVRWTKGLLFFGNQGAPLNKIKIMADGSVAACGMVTDNNFWNYGVVCRFDSSGNMLWSKSLELPGYDIAQLHSLTVLPGGKILAVGDCWSTNNLSPFPLGWICCFDSNGNLLWNNLYSMNGNVKFTHIIPNGNDLYIAGSSDLMDTVNGLNFYSFPLLAKLDTNGQIAWVHHSIFTERFSASIQDLVVQNDGNLTMTLQIIDNIPNTPARQFFLNIDRNSGYPLHIIEQPQDYYITALYNDPESAHLLFSGYYDVSNFQSNQIFGCIPSDWSSFCNYTAIPAPDDSIGEMNALPFVPVLQNGTDTAMVSSAVNMNVARSYCASYVGIPEVSVPGSFSVYPNPANESFTVSALQQESEQHFDLYDAQGKLLQTFILQPQQTVLKINRGNFPAGMYLLRIRENGIAERVIFYE